jgi:IS30 family transposase
MGTKYKQLSGEERLTIYHWHANGKSLRAIARELGLSPGTVSRELCRNSKPTKQWQGGYHPMRADKLAYRRRRWDNRHKLPRHKSRRGRLGMRGGSPASTIKHRVPISLRPTVINERRQPGHWEADLMLFAKYGQAIFVVHERTSRCLMLSHQPNKAVTPVVEALTRMLAPLPQTLRRSITFDNGTEFAFHYKLKETIGVETYFCGPHKPWQKGGVENAISRLRRTLRRKTDLATLNSGKLDQLVQTYNQTPRKCLGFKTPQEVFIQNVQPLHFKRESTSPPRGNDMSDKQE